jgi:transcriptional regulatory protein LEU3
VWFSQSSPSALAKALSLPCPALPFFVAGVCVCTYLRGFITSYLEHFHPYLPILRKKNPDECYDASPPLFWTVLFIGSRRYRPRGGSHGDNEAGDLHTTLADDYLADAVWSGAASPTMGLEGVHALLLLAAWPLPAVRLSTDPSGALVGVALNACMCMGLHVGVRSRGEFATAMKQRMVLNGLTDEDAAATWAACCTLAQKTAANAAHPPLPIPFSDAPWRPVLARRPAMYAGLVALFDIHQFLARFHTAMAAQIAALERADDASVQSWEDDFDTFYPTAIAPVVGPVVADDDSNDPGNTAEAAGAGPRNFFSRFVVLAARLEIQAYYFHSPPALPPGPNFRLHAARIFATARAVVLAIIDFENQGGSLAHIPQWGFRALFDAACIILSILHSDNAPTLVPVPPPDSGLDPGPAETSADTIARQAYETVFRCSVWHDDLPHRGATMLEVYWALRDEMPTNPRAPCALAHRTGAGVSLWALSAFKDRLIEVSHKTARTAMATRALDVMRIPPKKPDPDDNHNHNTQEPPTPADAEAFSEMDWTRFLEEFEWDGNDSLFFS